MKLNMTDMIANITCIPNMSPLVTGFGVNRHLKSSSRSFKVMDVSAHQLGGHIDR